MSIAQWPDKAWVKVFADDEVVRMGTYTPNVNEQFKRNASTLYGGLYVYLFINGALAGTERIRTLIYGDTAYSSALYTSSWTDLSDISNIATRWHGWVFTEFTSGHLNKNSTYYIGCEIDQYTRNGTTFYIGLKYDYPNPVYGSASTLFSSCPIAFKPYTYKARVA